MRPTTESSLFNLLVSLVSLVHSVKGVLELSLLILNLLIPFRYSRPVGFLGLAHFAYRLLLLKN